MTDDRAVSMPIQYVLLIATVALLSSGLMVSAGGFVQSQQHVAVRDGLEVVGNRLAGDLAAADRLGGALGDSGTLEITINTPRQVAGTGYLISIESPPGTNEKRELRLESIDPEVSVTIGVVTDRPLVNGTVAGGPLVVSYDPTTERLEVSNG